MKKLPNWMIKLRYVAVFGSGRIWKLCESCNVEELGVEKVLEEGLAVEEVARKEALEREETRLVELFRRMDVGKVDGK